MNFGGPIEAVIVTSTVEGGPMISADEFRRPH